MLAKVGTGLDLVECILLVYVRSYPAAVVLVISSSQSWLVSGIYLLHTYFLTFIVAAILWYAMFSYKTVLGLCL